MRHCTTNTNTSTFKKSFHPFPEGDSFNRQTRSWKASSWLTSLDNWIQFPARRRLLLLHTSTALSTHWTQWSYFDRCIQYTVSISGRKRNTAALFWLSVVLPTLFLFTSCPSPDHEAAGRKELVVRENLVSGSVCRSFSLSILKCNYCE